MINVDTASNELDTHSINEDASPRSRRTAMPAEYMPTDVFIPAVASTPVDFRITGRRGRFRYAVPSFKIKAACIPYAGGEQ